MTFLMREAITLIFNTPAWFYVKHKQVFVPILFLHFGTLQWVRLRDGRLGTTDSQAPTFHHMATLQNPKDWDVWMVQLAE